MIRKEISLVSPMTYSDLCRFVNYLRGERVDPDARIEASYTQFTDKRGGEVTLKLARDD